MYLCNTGISDKYNDNYFAWTKFGLIPVIRYSDIVFCGTTFISVDMLNEKQKELWDSVHSKLLEHNLLKGSYFSAIGVLPSPYFTTDVTINCKLLIFK